MNPTSKDVGQFRDILGEIASERVMLICPKHNYTALRKRANGVVAIPPEPRGCPDCINCYFVTDLALTPPDKRQERVDELEEIIHHMIEFEKTGKLGAGLELYEPGDPRFQVQYEQGAADDDTGEDKIKVSGEEEVH